MRTGRRAFVRKDRGARLTFESVDILLGVGFLSLCWGIVQSFVMHSGRGSFFFTIGLLDLVVWTPRLVGTRLRERS